MIMNLQEQITRIHSMMGLNESELPLFLKRRLNINSEEILLELKKWLLAFADGRTKEEILDRSFSGAAQELFGKYVEELPDEKVNEYYAQLKKYLEEKYFKEIEDYYNLVIEGTDDDEVYSFIKHSDLHMRLGHNRGFSESVRGWHQFLSKKGYWFPDINWSEVKEKLQPGKQFLLKKPLEGHNYHYYFSILKK